MSHINIMADAEKLKSDKITSLVCMIIFGLVMIIGIALFVFSLTRKNYTGPPCTVNGDCLPTETCVSNHCANQCTKTSDCPYSSVQTCVQGYCYSLPCDDPTDCPGTDMACVNSFCTPVGGKCDNNSQCFNGLLSCATGACVQCVSDGDCPDGRCGPNGICNTNCTSTSCGSGVTCTLPGYCCAESNGPYKNKCDNSDKCTSSQFCVNQACTCARGSYGDICASNNDCLSNNCLSINSKEGKCANPGDQCIKNFTPNESGKGYCGTDKPYCGNGICSSSPENAPCACNNSDDSGGGVNCNIYNSCNIGTGATGNSLYCVNLYCSLSPGWSGDICTNAADCAALNGNAPNCQGNTATNSILRCV